MRAVIRRSLEGASRVRLDYAEVVDARTLARPEPVQGEVLLALAARVGTTRLIDNLQFRAPASGAGGSR